MQRIIRDLQNYHTRSLCHYRLLCDDSSIYVIQQRYLLNESHERIAALTPNFEA